MGCCEIKRIIDQFGNREVPVSALNDIRDHLESCSCCQTYLDDSNELSRMMQSCGCVDNECSDQDASSDKFFLRIEREMDQCDEDKLKPTVLEMVVYHPYARPISAGALVLLVLLLGVFAGNNIGLFDKQSPGEKALEASMRNLPEGAILMKTSTGEEYVFIDPALYADGTYEKALKELEEALSNKSMIPSEGIHFVSD